jgi:hypothetical protein
VAEVVRRARHFAARGVELPRPRQRLVAGEAAEDLEAEVGCRFGRPAERLRVGEQRRGECRGEVR